MKPILILQRILTIIFAFFSLAGMTHASPDVSRPLSPAQLAKMSALKLCLLRNEIYARHGYRFVGSSPRSEMLREYFGGQSWYHPDTSDSTLVASRFTSVERHNVDALVLAARGKPDIGLPSASPGPSLASGLSPPAPAPYISYVTPHHQARVLHRHAASAPAVTHSITVWVNTNSGVYHYPGQRWYGATAQGEYMSEDAAIKAGYRATMNGQ